MAGPTAYLKADKTAHEKAGHWDAWTVACWALQKAARWAWRKAAPKEAMKVASLVDSTVEWKVYKLAASMVVSMAAH